MSKLFVGGLAWATDENSLKTHFANYGEVTDAKVISDRETGRSRGFGFITFAEESSANEALENLNGSELDGRTIRVDKATERSGGGGGRGSRDGGGGGGGGGGRW